MSDIRSNAEQSSLRTPAKNIFEQGLSRYLTDAQLTRIRQARIGIAGAGGLGSNIAVALVRTGFRQLEILDKDRVEASNLNRQDYTLADIGAPKVECLKTRLLSINPDLNLKIHNQEWIRATAALDRLLEDNNIIIEAFDQAGIKTSFVEYFALTGKPVICGNGMAGLHTATEITARKTGNIYLIGDGITSIHDGHAPLAPRVLQCAARMAQTVLELVLSKP